LVSLQILNMEKKIRQILKTVFGYNEFRDLQEPLIRNLLNKNDSLGIMPTGSGKSLCYQIPALIFEGLTIVVSPLISLMKDQVDQLIEYGIKATCLNSSLPKSKYEATISEISRKDYKLLYVAPETLLTDRLLWLLQGIPVSLITVDEAHCISEWGHDFRPEYRQLTLLREKFPSAVILALTATATTRVRHDIAQILKIKAENIFVSSFNRPNLFLEVDIKADIRRQMVSFIKKFPEQSGIIYCGTRKQVDEYTHFLGQHNFSVLPYHAGLSDAERWQNQETFSRDDVQIMVATIAFGMGINKPNIRYILHTDLPKNIETYYQQIGRAGRDGEPSQCLLLFNYGDIAKIKYFFRDKDEPSQRHETELLQQIIRYCEADVCRRQILLNYFGEEYKKQNCHNCDNCLTGDQEKEDLTIPAQKFLSCIWRTRQIFGASYIINILRGSSEKRILENNHDKLSTYNIGKELSKTQWMELYSKLASAKVIRRDPQHGSLILTDKAWDILNGKDKYLGRLRKEEKPLLPEKIAIEYDEKLFQLLRQKRKLLADDKNVPPYVILPDKSLQELAFYLPHSQESLLSIHGFGETKCKVYAHHFLPIISEYAKLHNKKEIKKSARQKTTHRYIEIGELFNSGNSIPEIAQKSSVTEDTVLKHLQTYVQFGNDLNRLPDSDDNFPSESVLNEILPRFKRLGSDFLKPVYESYQGTIPYETLRKARLIFLINELRSQK